MTSSSSAKSFVRRREMKRPSQSESTRVIGDNTPEKHRGLRPPWERGTSGNPAGRPTGSRTKVSEAFLADFLDVWAASGKAAIERVAGQFPAVFVRIAASLLPKHFKHERAFGDMSDEHIERRIRELDAAIAEETAAKVRKD